MLDENAFGILISDFNIEDDEYALPAEEFGARVQRFRDVVFDYLASSPLANDARALDLGHAVFIEFGEGEQSTDPIAWIRELRNRVSEQELLSVGVLTHGSRWVDDEHGVQLEAEQRYVGTVALTSWSNPSEPLRRALYADTAMRAKDEEHDDSSGWGPGLYIDTEAIEALGRVLKNQPTGLSVAGAVFFRVSR
jgi:hypothetical protein